MRAASGGQYGELKALEDAQKVIPLPTANAQPSAPQGAAPAQMAAPAPVVAPGDINFEGPTQRPSEPVTAGLPVGPGPGPEVLNLPTTSATDPSIVLRSIYQNVPQAQNNDVLRLIEAMDTRIQ